VIQRFGTAVTATVLSGLAFACGGGRESVERDVQANQGSAPIVTQATPAPGTPQGAPSPVQMADGSMPATGDQATLATTPPAPSTAVAAPEPEGELGKALRLQVRLDRAGFSPGEIDGKMGSNVKRALAQWRKAKNHADDAAATVALDQDTAPTLVQYTLTEQDVAGPYVKIPEDMMEKAKLDKLGYTSALEALGEKFHASPALLQQLNKGQALDAAGTAIVVPNVETTVLGRAASVVVDKSDFSLNALDEAGNVLASYPATMGSKHDPLPIGTWKINGVDKDPAFNYNPDLFWDAEKGHAKATIPAGPNNPVGVVWIDLSKEHYGIHGTPEPSTIGKTQSHGCIRLTNWDAAELAGLVAPGVKAELQP
jgi:lipoprotein-anchoring transpeptidase ErfK/SrfK